MRVKRPLLFIQLLGLLASPIFAQPASDTSKTSPATVPVTLKSVRQGSFVPTSRTLLTVKTEDGKYVIHEVVPNSEGVAELELAPGKYVLSAAGARDSLAFVVAPPRCTFTIQVSDSGEPVSLSENTQSSAGERGTIGTDKILAFVFGVFFVVILLLFVPLRDRYPSPIAILIYRVVLALAAAGIGAVIPGMIDVNISSVMRAGGAVALFAIVYWFKPADLVAGPRDPAAEDTGKRRSTGKMQGQLGKLSPSQNAELVESMERFKSLSGESIDRAFKPIQIKRTVTVDPPNAELDVLEELINLSDGDQYQLTRHVTSDAPIAKKTMNIKAWVKIDGSETEASVDVRPSPDGRIFSVRIGFKGHVVRVGKTVHVRWRCKFPGAVALNEDYWVFPLGFYEKRAERLVVEVGFLSAPADLNLFAASEVARTPVDLVGPDARDKEGKPYLVYSSSIDKPDDFYVVRWRIE